MKVSLSNRTPALSLASFKSILRITSNAQDTYLQTLIDAATEEAYEYTGRYFGTVTATVVAEWNSSFVLPFPRPVISLDSVSLDGTALAEGVGYTFDSVKNEIHFLIEGDEIEVVYSAGIASEVPADALQAIGQRGRQLYDYPDNPRAIGNRNFEVILFRHKEGKSLV